LAGLINFHYDPFQENVGILGMQGSGKTTLAKQILDDMPNIPRWIWSPQRPMDHYGSYGVPVGDVSKMRGDAACLWTGDFSATTFDRFCAAAMQWSNMVIVWDDIHEFVKKQKIPEPFARLINSGRNRGISNIFLTPSPNIVNNVVLQSCKHIFAFPMGIESQIFWLSKNYYGPDAYVLLPRPLRRIEPSIGNEWDVLPRYSYLYRKHTDTQNTLVIGDGAPQQQV